ncbi:putative inactive purple acid phosphatase 28, partial [Mucuna pruriens]
MEAQNWKHSFLYLTFLLAILHLTHNHLSRKLFLGNETVRIKKNPDLPLRFRSDGTFKILQVADMHYGIGSVTRCRDVLASEFDFCSDLNTTRFLKRIIQAENPDFVAFTGAMSNWSIAAEVAAITAER